MQHLLSNIDDHLLVYPGRLRVALGSQEQHVPDLPRMIGLNGFSSSGQVATVYVWRGHDFSGKRAPGCLSRVTKI